MPFTLSLLSDIIPSLFPILSHTRKTKNHTFSTQPANSLSSRSKHFTANSTSSPIQSMAEISRPISVAASARRQPSRLQRRAPASLQISPVSDWNIAIPLLSPLTSPSSPPPAPAPIARPHDRTADAKSRDLADSDKPPVVVFKKWQHPAAPFSYESPPPFVRPFVPARK